MDQAAVLLYDPQGIWTEGVKKLCAQRALRFRQVEDGELGWTLAQLAGGKRAGAAPTLRPLPEPVVVYCKVGGGGLDQLLAGLARLGMPRTVLKAVLTPTNAGWTFAALYGELVRERKAML